MKQLPFEAIVALRYLRSKRKPAVMLVTGITVGGVAVGVAALAVVTSVWNGFEAEFIDKLLGINAHGVLVRHGDVFRDAERVMAEVERVPGVTHVAPFVYSEVIAQAPTNLLGVAIKGIDPDNAKKTALARYVPPGALDRLARPETITSTSAFPTGGTSVPTEAAPVPGILIGRELATILRRQEGDRLTIVSPYGGASGEPHTQAFRVAGIFHSGMYEFDARMVFIALPTAQAFFRLHQTITGLEIWTADPMESRTVLARVLGRLSPLDYDVRDWSRTNRGLFGAVRSQKTLVACVLGFIVLVAAFNIAATLVLLILEKRREIAVLKALGASPRSILKIFIIDGALVGMAGSLIGLLLGIVVSVALARYGLALDAKVYYLERLPVLIKPLDLVLVTTGALTASVLATLYPSFAAARIRPVDGLRQGGGGPMAKEGAGT